jgi:hypothetical protein
LLIIGITGIYWQTVCAFGGVRKKRGKLVKMIKRMKFSDYCKKACKFYENSSKIIDYIELSQNLLSIIS